MISLSKNQKMVLWGLSLVIIGVIAYYLIDKNTKVDYSEIISTNETVNIVVEVSIPQDEIIVHITGAVKNQGIVRLKEGDRINDAVDKAGGATEEADLNKINLAYMLQDGQKIYIPSIYDVDLDEAKLEEYR